MKSEVFIIPGFKHSSLSPDYQKIGDIFKDKGIQPNYVEIPWKNTTIAGNLAFFLDIYQRSKADRKYVLGFSFGAVIALLAATKASFDTIFLCSLSPYFPEDLPTLRKSWISSIGKGRLNDFKSFNTKALTSNIKAKTFILYGADEGIEIEKRATTTFRQLSVVKELIRVADSKHDIGNKNYHSEIKKLVGKLI